MNRSRNSVARSLRIDINDDTLGGGLDDFRLKLILSGVGEIDNICISINGNDDRYRPKSAVFNVPQYWRSRVDYRTSTVKPLAQPIDSTFLDGTGGDMFRARRHHCRVNPPRLMQ